MSPTCSTPDHPPAFNIEHPVPTNGAHLNINRPSTPAMMYNGFIASNTIHALIELGIMDVLCDGKPHSLDNCAKLSNAHAELIDKLLNIACLIGMISRDGDHHYVLTKYGAEFQRMRGFFTWAVGGYGQLFRQLAHMARLPHGAEKTAFYRPLIDGSHVAVGSNLCNETLMKDLCLNAIENIDFSKIADLGCGNAGRLIDICQRRGNVIAIGVDVNAGAVEEAKKFVFQRNMQHRITIRQGDALNASQLDCVKDVDLVTSFLMMHDQFNARAPDEVVECLLKSFPQARHFVVADTFRMEHVDSIESAPIFSLGFELAHKFMGIHIYRPEDYIATFSRHGMRLVSRVELGAPNTFLLVFRR